MSFLKIKRISCLDVFHVCDQLHLLHLLLCAQIANEDFHEWDPGRFIKGAKAGMLVPYSMKGTISQMSDAAKAYRQEFTAWKARWRKLETVSSKPYRSSLAPVRNQPVGKHDDERPAELAADQEEVEAFRIRQPEPEMAT